MQESTEPKTKVIFRVWKETGTLIALFPELPADNYGAFCVSYEHVGQHGGANYNGVIDQSRPAHVSEIDDLKAELEGIGYNLQVIHKCTSVMDRVRREAARR